jgi:geranylgeranyl pyrophosphate synthase
MTGLEAGPRERVESWLQEGRLWAEQELEGALDEVRDAPEQLLAAMRHSLLAGGKRLRPSLVRLFAEAAGGDEECARRPAVAIEMVHTYSLVHDDLPCMDDDDMRRGIPTVHKQWDEATAVLAGDALLTEAFTVISAHPCAGSLTRILARAAGASGMVGGQVLDLTVSLSRGDSQAADGDWEAVEEIHRLKTAALFGASCELGWAAAGGAGGTQEAAKRFGVALGHLFQATDDLIDVTGSADGLGKTPGKDAALSRPTLVAALGLEGASARASEFAELAREAAAQLGFSEGHPAHDLISLLLTRAH